MKKVNVHFFGDSICFGQGVSLYKGWVPRIAEKLDDTFGCKGVDVIVTNNAANGRTTRQALEQMPYEIQAHRPDILIIQFGMNDCNYWNTDRGVPRVSREAFRANLREIITRAFVFGIKKIAVNTNHPTTRTQDCFPLTNITYQQSNEVYNEIIREVCKDRNNVVLIDIEKEMTIAEISQINLSDYVLEDKLHLSLKGHDFYFRTIYPVIENLVYILIEKKLS